MRVGDMRVGDMRVCEGGQVRARREEAAWRAMQRRVTQHPLVRRARAATPAYGIGS